MLIDLSLPLTIDPSQYPTTLAIQLDTDNRPECGVFAGRHAAFDEHEEGKAVPVVHDEGDGRKTFLLDRDAGSREHMSRDWHYAALGWEGGIYVDRPYVYTLALKEYVGNGDDGRDAFFWTVTVLANDNPIFTLQLPDYQPGAAARGLFLPNLPS